MEADRPFALDACLLDVVGALQKAAGALRMVLQHAVKLNAIPAAPEVSVFPER